MRHTRPEAVARNNSLVEKASPERLSDMHVNDTDIPAQGNLNLYKLQKVIRLL
jgi:hypothetical protein